MAPGARSFSFPVNKTDHLHSLRFRWATVRTWQMRMEMFATGQYPLSHKQRYAGDFKPVTLAPGQYGQTAYFTPFAQTHASSLVLRWYLDHRSCGRV